MDMIRKEEKNYVKSKTTIWIWISANWSQNFNESYILVFSRASWIILLISPQNTPTTLLLNAVDITKPTINAKDFLTIYAKYYKFDKILSLNWHCWKLCLEHSIMYDCFNFREVKNFLFENISMYSKWVLVEIKQ